VAITPACFQLGLVVFHPVLGFLVFVHVHPCHGTTGPRPLAPDVSITSSLLAAWLGALLQFSSVFPSFFWVAVAPRALCSALDSCLAPSTSLVITFICQQLSKRSWIPAHCTLLALNYARHL
jgi:hypothetical protein